MRVRSFALISCLALAAPAVAQTTSTGTGTTGTGTTGTTGTSSIPSGTSGAGSNRVSTSNSGSGFGSNTGSSASGPFQGTVPASFSGSAGTSTQTNTGAGQGISGTIAVPSTFNPWLTTFGNPYAIGQSVLGAGSTSKSIKTNRGFGQPVYSITNTTINTFSGLQGNPLTGGFNNLSMSKTPRYTSALSDDIPFVVHPPGQLQVKLQDILARSSSLRNGDRIQVVVEDGVVVLAGQVGSERERRVAESMLRLQPGVVDVENRLSIGGATVP